MVMVKNISDTVKLLVKQRNGKKVMMVRNSMWRLQKLPYTSRHFLYLNGIKPVGTRMLRPKVTRQPIIYLECNGHFTRTEYKTNSCFATFLATGAIK